MPPRRSVLKAQFAERDAPTDGNIDEISVISDPLGLFHYTSAFVPQGSTVRVSGWLIDTASMLPCSSVWVRIDEVLVIQADYGLPSPAAAKQFETGRVADCGFQAAIATDELPIGNHQIEIFGIDRSGTKQLRKPGVTGFHVIAALCPTDPTLPNTIYPFRVSIDRVDEQTLESAEAAANVVERSKGAILRVRGWAADPAGLKNVGSIYVRIGKHTYQGVYGGFERPDVAEALGHASLKRCGFEIIVSTEILERGRHAVSAIAVAEDHSCYAEVSEVCRLELYERPPAWASLARKVYEQRPGRIDNISWERPGEGVERPLLQGMVPDDAVVTVTGWIANGESQAWAGGAVLEVDGKECLPVEIGENLEMRHLGAYSLNRSKFRIKIDSRMLPLGTHSVRLFVLGEGMRSRYPTHSEGTFRVIKRLQRVTAVGALNMVFATKRRGRRRSKVGKPTSTVARRFAL